MSSEITPNPQEGIQPQKKTRLDTKNANDRKANDKSIWLVNLATENARIERQKHLSPDTRTSKPGADRWQPLDSQEQKIVKNDLKKLANMLKVDQRLRASEATIKILQDTSGVKLINFGLDHDLLTLNKTTIRYMDHIIDKLENSAPKISESKEFKEIVQNFKDIVRILKKKGLLSNKEVQALQVERVRLEGGASEDPYEDLSMEQILNRNDLTPREVMEEMALTPTARARIDTIAEYPVIGGGGGEPTFFRRVSGSPLDGHCFVKKNPLGQHELYFTSFPGQYKEVEGYSRMPYYDQREDRNLYPREEERSNWWLAEIRWTATNQASTQNRQDVIVGSQGTSSAIETLNIDSSSLTEASSSTKKPIDIVKTQRRTWKRDRKQQHIDALDALPTTEEKEKYVRDNSRKRSYESTSYISTQRDSWKKNKKQSLVDALDALPNAKEKKEFIDQNIRKRSKNSTAAIYRQRANWKRDGKQSLVDALDALPNVKEKEEFIDQNIKKRTDDGISYINAQKRFWERDGKQSLVDALDALPNVKEKEEFIDQNIRKRSEGNIKYISTQRDSWKKNGKQSLVDALDALSTTEEKKYFIKIGIIESRREGIEKGKATREMQKLAKEFEADNPLPDISSEEEQ